MFVVVTSLYHTGRKVARHVLLVEEAMPAADRPYKIVAVKQDGGRETIGEGYTSRGHCFASATNAAIGIKTVGNPHKVDRLELENVRGEGLQEYNGSPDLCIATC